MRADHFRPSRLKERRFVIAGVVFNVLLLTAPREFRRHYRASMVQHFRIALGEEHALNGTLGVLRYALVAYVDLVVSSLRERSTMIVHDIVFALRTARTQWLFSTIVVATLAIAIGANVAVYSVLAGVLLKPLPYPDPARLVFVREVAYGALSPTGPFSLPNAVDVNEHVQAFTGAAASYSMTATLLGHGEPKVLEGIATTYNLFDVIGVKPEIGRFFTTSDEADGTARAIVLSDDIWRTIFARDPAVIGTTVVLSGVSYRVVGVAPPGFKQPDAHRSGPWTPDFWHVFKAHNITDRGDHFAPMVARLRPGVSVAAANAGLARLFDELGRKYPTDDAHRTAVAVPLRQQLLGDVAPMLVTIYLAVVGVLLVACANVANLFLSRAAAREREVSVRFAVGASRGRILAQLFTEALLYVGAGGVLGFGLATIGIREFLAMKPPGIPFLDAVSVDWTVAAYTLAIVIATTLLTGLVPAVGLSRPDLSVALKAGGRGGDSSRGGRARNALAIAEIALALALVTASALSVRSFLALTGEPIGIDPTNVYVAAIRGFPVRYETDTNAVRNFQARVLEKLKGSPLIEDAAFDAMFPFGDRHSDTTLLFPGVHYAPGQEPATNISDATPDAFDVLREPLLRGRRFDERDGPGGAPVAIVNEAFVKRFFPDGNAIGKRIKPDQASVEKEPPYRTIVGIVGNAPEDFVTPDNPATWVPSAQEPDISSGILVRSRGSRADIAAVLKDAVTAADATMPAPKIESLGSKMSDSVARVRIGAALLALLAGVALFLAVAGVYAVISYGVERRTHEIGIRMALGARSGQVVAMILRGAGAMAAIGILAGLGLAAASSRMLQSQLVGITALDPWTYVCVVAILVSAVILAAAIPALRAARVDPNEALRYE